jgi:hypothetical protein
MAFGTIRADIIQGTASTINLATAGQYSFQGNILPDVDGSRSLGSNTLRWQDLYVNDVSSGSIIPTGPSFTKDLGTAANQWGYLYVGLIDSFQFAGTSRPTADNTIDLGSASLRFANIYAANVRAGDLHLKNDKGDWTMIEAEDYLTLRNNKTGKTFKLLMEEVES